jgi:RIO kinase 1
LHVDTTLTGHVEQDTTPVDLEAVLQELEDTRLDEEARLRYEESLRSGT